MCIDDSSVENEHVDVVINIRELDDVLMRDVGNKIADSGKWVLCTNVVIKGALGRVTILCAFYLYYYASQVPVA